LYQLLRQAVAERERIALATVVAPAKGQEDLLGRKLLITGSGIYGDLGNAALTARMREQAPEFLLQRGAQLVEIAGACGAAGVFVEPLHPVARLLVLGGGHIAQPLVAIASLLEYEITVIDDRPSFADHRRFPGARSVVCDDFSRALFRQRFDAGTSVVIVTRGHLHDLECLKQVLPAEPGYVGMIGSRRRIRLVREHLLAAGFPEEQVNRVFMPIGLEIGAETPAEIAISIAAQLTEARRGRGRYPLPPTSTNEQWQHLVDVLDHVDRGWPVVAATIVRTRGSTPRKPGVKMLLSADGSVRGTIGGGCGEAAVRSEAMMLFDSGAAPGRAGRVPSGRGPGAASIASGFTARPERRLKAPPWLKPAGTPGMRRTGGRGRGAAARLFSVAMDADVDAEEGMACGGVMDVFLERLV
jgi:xanthine dehydrogenase accessory factor